MQAITARKATEDEIRTCEIWDLWESGDISHFEHFYDQDTQFITLSGSAVIHVQGCAPVVVEPGVCVRILKGAQGRWDISAPIVNRYRYRYLE